MREKREIIDMIAKLSGETQKVRHGKAGQHVEVRPESTSRNAMSQASWSDIWYAREFVGTPREDGEATGAIPTNRSRPSVRAPPASPMYLSYSIGSEWCLGKFSAV